MTESTERSRQVSGEAQEALTEVWCKAPPLFDTSRSNAAFWAVTITHRRAIDRVRSVQASVDRDRQSALRQQQRAFDEVSEKVENRLEYEQVRRCLQALSPLQRESVLLAYYDGCTYRETAERLGTALGTASLRAAVVRDGPYLSMPSTSPDLSNRPREPVSAHRTGSCGASDGNQTRAPNRSSDTDLPPELREQAGISRTGVSYRHLRSPLFTGSYWHVMARSPGAGAGAASHASAPASPSDRGRFTDGAERVLAALSSQWEVGEILAADDVWAVIVGGRCRE
ncbi:sigma-70 family RNA polymerase sigma factor [Streptomyces sp. NBC_00466]|uniref:sigma-70 family RNA polymerase sigma factor n=1 Tax=Streptomyces sp. NBC_00466 TaxID=2903655 RepID=UPI00324725A9